MAQQAQPEPTMEEILASIRRIISEDADEGQKRAPSEPHPPAAVESSAEEEEVLELTEVVEDERPVAPEPKAKAPAEATPAREPQPPPRPRAPVPPSPRVVEEEEEVMLVDRERESGEEGLLSSSAASAMSSAFSQLAERTRIASEPSVTLEDMVRQMIKPMLKEWLEAHLPPLVERLVQEEIERTARQASKRR